MLLMLKSDQNGIEMIVKPAHKRKDELVKIRPKWD